MGLFDFFRKKKITPDKETPKAEVAVLNEPEQAESLGTSIDFNPLNIDSVIGHVKTRKPDATEQEVANIITKLAEPEEDQDHLTPEGDLPWGWRSVHEKEIKRYEAKYKRMWSAWYDSRYKSPNEHLAALEAFVNYMERTKKLLEKKGECFNYWRDDLFTDDYLQKMSAKLADLQANIEKLNVENEAKQVFERNVLPTLTERLNQIIRNNPGILQKDIYKMFDPVAQSYIKEKLYFAEKSGEIIREKSGNTYKLFMK